MTNFLERIAEDLLRAVRELEQSDNPRHRLWARHLNEDRKDIALLAAAFDGDDTTIQGGTQ